MKTKPITIGLALVALTFAACKKNTVWPDRVLGKDIDGVSIGPSVTNSNSYQPVTKGSTWTYKTETSGQKFTTTTTMTGEKATFNGKVYYKAVSTSSIPTGAGDGYYYSSDNEFAMRGSNVVVGATVDVPFLKSNLPVDGTWEAPINDAGAINGTPGKFLAKLAAKNITKTVEGKTYSAVMHTKMDLQYEILGSWQSFGLYDIYVAKGVGIIQLDLETFGVQVSHQTLASYNIK